MVTTTILFLLFIPPGLHGQIRDNGIKLGAIASRQTWDYKPQLIDPPIGTRWGIDVGVFVEWFNLPFLSVLTELHFVERGASYETSIFFPEMRSLFLRLSPEIDYLSLPIMFKIRYEGESGEIFALAGPRADLKAGTRISGDDGVSKHLRDVSYGMTIGAGVRLRDVLSHPFGFEYRYSPTVGEEYSSPTLDITGSSMEILMSIGL